jgi:hypothetical protein
MTVTAYAKGKLVDWLCTSPVGRGVFVSVKRGSPLVLDQG